MAWAGHYDSFGNCQVVQELIENNLRFPGQYYDAETGLHYNWNRYYDPATGRYLSTDPIGDGLNLYAYCFNNPHRWIDPTGLCAIAGFWDRVSEYGYILGGTIWSTGAQVLQGILYAPADLARQIIDWLDDPYNYNKIPVVGPLGAAIGTSWGRAAETGDFGDISVAVGNTAFGALTALGGAEFARGLGAPRGARNAPIEYTKPGERFVRVGNSPENLKFSFERPGGVQKGTYAFPEETFNKIGNNPAKLKNLGDLPGAAPQYYRVLEPPTATPIQRGVVPGGEFGGRGRVPEVLFPEGF